MAMQQCDQTIFSPSSTLTPYKIPTSVTLSCLHRWRSPPCNSGPGSRQFDTFFIPTFYSFPCSCSILYLRAIYRHQRIFRGVNIYIVFIFSFPDVMASHLPRFEVSKCLWKSGQPGAKLRRNPHHQERPWQPLLRCQLQVRGSRHWEFWRRFFHCYTCIPGNYGLVSCGFFLALLTHVRIIMIEINI